jgi:hypothetical protein
MNINLFKLIMNDYNMRFSISQSNSSVHTCEWRWTILTTWTKIGQKGEEEKQKQSSLQSIEWVLLHSYVSKGQKWWRTALRTFFLAASREWFWHLLSFVFLISPGIKSTSLILAAKMEPYFHFFWFWHFSRYKVSILKFMPIVSTVRMLFKQLSR